MQILLHKEDKMIRVNLCLDKEDYEELQKISDKEGMSKSWLVRKAVKQFIKYHKEK